MITALLVAILLPTPAAPAPPDVCRMFTSAQVAAVLGAAPTGSGTALLPGMCAWNVPGTSLTVSATEAGEPAAAAGFVDAVRAAQQRGEVVKDEPGLGDHALSDVGPNGRSVDLRVAAASRVWRFTVEKADQKLDVDAVLPHLRDMARAAVAAK